MPRIFWLLFWLVAIMHIVDLQILRILVIALTLASGATRVVERLARQYFANDYVVLLAFTAAFGLAETILTLPLQYYSGFYLEHKYNLSNQTIWRWIWVVFTALSR